MRQFSINLFREKNEQNFATQEVQYFPPKRKSNFFGKQINAKKREVSHFPSTKAMQKNFHGKISNFTANPSDPTKDETSETAVRNLSGLFYSFSHYYFFSLIKWLNCHIET